MQEQLKTNNDKQVDYALNYYSSENAYNYYSIVQSPDYTGSGIYPHQEKDDEFYYGTGCSVEESMINRNEKMLELLFKYQGESKKVNILELGSGRGGHSRYCCKRLKEKGIKGKYVCCNLIEKENQYNRKKSEEEGIEDFEVLTLNFESMEIMEDGQFDVVMANDCIFHSGNIQKVFNEIQRLLRVGGHFIVSEITQNENCNQEKIQEIINWFKLNNFPTVSEYQRYASNAKMTVEEHFDMSVYFARHYARLRYELTHSKKEELLKNVTEDFYKRVLERLAAWVVAINDNNLNWIWFIMQKQQ